MLRPAFGMLRALAFGSQAPWFAEIRLADGDE